MMWVCRAGEKSLYLEQFLRDNRIYLPWDGYHFDLSQLKDLSEFKKAVIKEKGDQSRTSISNWAGQLLSFSHEMNVDDLVLIPHRSSRKYTLAKITGAYSFNPSDNRGLFHSRTIDILEDNIPREVFPQSLRYSLGAFRTIFKVKREEEVFASLRRGGAE